MPEPDSLHRFLFENSSVRGELVHLDATWLSVLDGTHYPDAVKNVLGEALTAAALLAATIKFEGSIILQARSKGPIRLLVVEARADHTVRGLARWSGQVAHAPLDEMMAGGQLVMTVDPGEGKERYQGIVDIEGQSVAASLHNYFERSEQLPTRLWLAVDDARVAGLLVQNMPEAMMGRDAQDEDAWERIVHLAETVTRAELLGLSAAHVLYRLFNGETVRLFKPTPLRFRCGCSRERVENMLRGIGLDELEKTLAEQGNISVDCEFCSASFVFDAVDLKQLFVSRDHYSAGATRH